jgi:hypothetical protein
MCDVPLYRHTTPRVSLIFISRVSLVLMLQDVMTRSARKAPFESNPFTKMCSSFEAGSYLGLTDFVYHSTLDLRAIKQEKTKHHTTRFSHFYSTLSSHLDVSG